TQLTDLWLITSPIVITLLLLFVSGVPLLEKNIKIEQIFKHMRTKRQNFSRLLVKKVCKK
ncbi:steroid 5-alpha reductase, partial [Vibrio parahaemolyticus]